MKSELLFSYDHLDLATVTAVLDKWPKVKFFVPLGEFTLSLLLSSTRGIDT